MKFLRILQISCLVLAVHSALGTSPTPSPTPLIPTPTPSPTPDISAMVARLKLARTANKPFTIYYDVGLSVTVPDANHWYFNPSGKFTFIVVFSGDDAMAQIPVYLITKLVLVSNFPFDPQ